MRTKYLNESGDLQNGPLSLFIKVGRYKIKKEEYPDLSIIRYLSLEARKQPFDVGLSFI